MTANKRRANQDKIPDFTQSTWLHLDRVTGRKINDYMLQTGLFRSKDVIAELVSVALSQNPAAAVDHSMRKKAYDDVRVWVIHEFYGMLNEMQERVMLMLKTAEDNFTEKQVSESDLPPVPNE